MSLADIAERMSCSSSAITAINRRFQIRKYDGRRTAWTTIESTTAFGHPSSRGGDSERNSHESRDQFSTTGAAN